MSQRIKIITVNALKKASTSLVITWICLFSLNAWSDNNAPSLEDVLNMEMVIHFIDVGVGDAILIELPGGGDHEILIDGGDSRFGYDVLDYVNPLIDPPLELAVITHADFDHWSGIRKVLNSGIPINELWDPGYDRTCKFTGSKADEKREKDQYLKFISNAKEKIAKIVRPMTTSWENPVYTKNGVKIWSLSSYSDPPGKECSYIVNNASIVLRVEYKNVSFLLTGDINGKERNDKSSVKPKYIEKALLDKAESLSANHLLDADVLKVPHHGSETANTRDFIRAVSPRFAVISSTSTYHYHLPRKRVTQRYQRIMFGDQEKIEQVFRTDFGEKDYKHKKFGDDHIICGTNGSAEDLVCDYIWRLQ